MISPDEESNSLNDQDDDEADAGLGFKKANAPDDMPQTDLDFFT